MGIGRDEIETNLLRVQERIAEAALRSQRQPETVRLVAITKSQPAQVVRIAYECGQRDFGENRVAEALDKQAELRDLVDVTWHMVGRIQSRKARNVAGKFAYIHSVDRQKIAHRLDQYLADIAQASIGFLELNASGEDTKAGWNLGDATTWRTILADVRPMLALHNLKIEGLMTMSAWNAGEHVIRETFSRLREFRDHLEQSFSGKLPDLSMGMTDDFEIAVEEGATVVRVGRAIFGSRM